MRSLLFGAESMQGLSPRRWKSSEIIYITKLEEQKGEKTTRIPRKSQDKGFREAPGEVGESPGSPRAHEPLLDFGSETLHVGKVLGS